MTGKITDPCMFNICHNSSRDSQGGWTVDFPLNIYFLAELVIRVSVLLREP